MKFGRGRALVGVRTCLEMARLERRAPALAATADIVTVADIVSDSCPDGSVAGRSDRRSRVGQIGQVPADPDHSRRSDHWSSGKTGSQPVHQSAGQPLCGPLCIFLFASKHPRELALLRPRRCESWPYPSRDAPMRCSASLPARCPPPTASSSPSAKAW